MRDGATVSGNDARSCRISACALDNSSAASSIMRAKSILQTRDRSYQSIAHIHGGGGERDERQDEREGGDHRRCASALAATIDFTSISRRSYSEGGERK